MSDSHVSKSASEVIDTLVRARRTSKLMLAPENLDSLSVTWTAEHARELRIMVSGAVWAPFHKRSHEATHRSGGELDSIVPWRFHVLERDACLALLSHLRQQAEGNPDSLWSRAWASKIKNMLAACGALVQVNWLPDPPDESSSQPAPGSQPVMSMNNIEHVAAAGAAVQNLLLAAEARGWRSYWSSGGVLRDAVIFDYLGIAHSEAPLGSVFLSPQLPQGVNIVDGGLREQRGPLESWARWVTLRAAQDSSSI